MRLDVAYRMTSVHPLNRGECIFPLSKRYSAQLKGAVENLSQKQGICNNKFCFKCQVMGYFAVILQFLFLVSLDLFLL